MTTLFCALGDRLGLLKALDANGPVSSEDLAARSTSSTPSPTEIEHSHDVLRRAGAWAYPSESIQRSSRRPSRAISSGSRNVLVSRAMPW